MPKRSSYRKRSSSSRRRTSSKAKRSPRSCPTKTRSICRSKTGNSSYKRTRKCSRGYRRDCVSSRSKRKAPARRKVSSRRKTSSRRRSTSKVSCRSGTRSFCVSRDGSQMYPRTGRCENGFNRACLEQPVEESIFPEKFRLKHRKSQVNVMTPEMQKCVEKFGSQMCGGGPLSSSVVCEGGVCRLSNFN